MAEYPSWVQKFKKPGYEIKLIKGAYYLYERSTVWNPEKKQARKKSGTYLGKITEEGLTTPKQKIESTTISVKEYGASRYVYDLSGDIRESLKEFFPRYWQQIYLLALLRLLKPAAFKRAADTYERSYLSVLHPEVPLGKSTISNLLDVLGDNREAIASYMRAHLGPQPFILIDGTRMTSLSRNMDAAQVGFNTRRCFLPQINLMYVFSVSGEPGPAFYRCVPGNIPDVSAFKLTMQDLGSRDMIVIADKGFASQENFSLLEEMQASYIVPLKRNTTALQQQDLSRRSIFEDAFTYGRRPVLAHTIPKKGYMVIVYRDESLRVEEEYDFIARREKKNASLALSKKAADKQPIDIGAETASSSALFGVLVLRTNRTDLSAHEVYELYKKRVHIEQSFDTLKTYLKADASYMHDDRGFEAWCFINHITLTVIYRICNAIKHCGLTSRYSVSDMITYLSGIKKLYIANRWQTAEITQKASKIAHDMGLNLNT